MMLVDTIQSTLVVCINDTIQSTLVVCIKDISSELQLDTWVFLFSNAALVIDFDSSVSSRLLDSRFCLFKSSEL
jgi:hypothetical protein